MTARVLVVDDIIANVKLLEARLTAEYFEVVSAYNGRDALDILAREPIDVVLLDVMMPGLDGFETRYVFHARHERYVINRFPEEIIGASFKALNAI